MQDNHYFERYSSSIDSLLQEKDIAYASEVLQELAVEVKRSRRINKEEKGQLVIKMATVSEVLNKPKESDSHELDTEDFDSIDSYVDIPSWTTLNPDKLPYAIWLRDVCLPRFFPLPQPELQNPVVATIALINSNSLPPKTKKMSLEPELPLVLFVGKSGSGKSTLAEWIGNHYADGAFQELLGSSSPKQFRDLCDKACNRGHKEPASDLFGKLRAAYVLIDNFEASYLDKWSSQKEIFLAVRRSQAVHGNSDAGARRIMQTAFYSHALKIATTIDTPDRVTAIQSDMARRMLPIFFENKGSGLGGYSFIGLDEQYKHCWCRDKVRKEFFPILSRFLCLDHEKTPINPEYYHKSVTVMATGCYLGIWKSEKEALEHMQAFWEYTDAKGKDNSSDVLLLSLEEFLTTQESKLKGMRRGAFGELRELPGIDAKKLYDGLYESILSAGVQRSRGKDFERDVSNLMRSRGYVLKKQATKFVFCRE